jgi:hypothetical protein
MFFNLKETNTLVKAMRVLINSQNKQLRAVIGPTLFEQISSFHGWSSVYV